MVYSTIWRKLAKYQSDFAGVPTQRGQLRGDQPDGPRLPAHVGQRQPGELLSRVFEPDRGLGSVTAFRSRSANASLPPEGAHPARSIAVEQDDVVANERPQLAVGGVDCCLGLGGSSAGDVLHEGGRPDVVLSRSS